MMTIKYGWLPGLLASFCFVWFALPCRAAPAPTFTLTGSDITLNSASTDGRAAMVLKGDNLDTTALTAPLGHVSDLNAPLPPQVDVKFTAYELDHTDSSRRWMLSAEIKGLPRNVAQTRYLSFTFEGQLVTLTYTLTNKSTAIFAWSVKGPPAELSLQAGQSINIGIAVQAVAATNVRVLQAALVEQSRKTLLNGGMMLCRQAQDPCNGASILLDQNSSNSLWLRSNDSGTIVGKYVGTVIIGASEKPDGETLNLTIYGTTCGRQLLGVLIIIFGVIGAWSVTVWAQNRLNRAQALLPAALLSDQTRALQQILGRAPPGTNANWPNTAAALRNLVQNLSPAGLDEHNYLPPVMPSPFRSTAPDTDGYKQVISDAGAKIALLDLLIKKGLAAVWGKIPAAPTDPQRQAIQAAFKTIDDELLKNPLPSLQVANTDIQSALNTLAAGLGGAAAVVPPGAPAPFQAPSFEQLTVQIRNLNGLVWLVFGGLVSAVGTYILIISNLGFGVPADYFTCLFWGFGLPIGGQQLMQLTTGSIGTTLGVAVPRTT